MRSRLEWHKAVMSTSDGVYWVGGYLMHGRRSLVGSGDVDGGNESCLYFAIALLLTMFAGYVIIPFSTNLERSLCHGSSSESQLLGTLLHVA
jgi:hypothetical protein